MFRPFLDLDPILWLATIDYHEMICIFKDGGHYAEAGTRMYDMEEIEKTIPIIWITRQIQKISLMIKSNILFKLVVLPFWMQCNFKFTLCM